MYCVILACKTQSKCARKKQYPYRILNHILQQSIFPPRVKCGGRENLFCLEFIGS